jgi:hypothetical protein
MKERKIGKICFMNNLIYSLYFTKNVPAAMLLSILSLSDKIRQAAALKSCKHFNFNT